MAWFLGILVGLALSIVAYLIMPRPKQPKPPATTDLESPTAEAGRPMMKVFGTKTIKSPNVLWSGEKAHDDSDVDA